MFTFLTYDGPPLPEVLHPLNPRHYLLPLDWIYLKPSRLKHYLYQADPNLYFEKGRPALKRAVRLPAYQNLSLMLPMLLMPFSIVLAWTTSLIQGTPANWGKITGGVAIGKEFTMHHSHILYTRYTYLLLALVLGLSLSACSGEGAPGRAILGDTWQRPSDVMTMVYVPAGTFVMGSDAEETEAALSTCQAYSEDCTADLFSDELPAHTVDVESFWLDQTEVSNAQYQRCVDEGACEPGTCASDARLNASEQPVVCVSWLQAEAYCTWAGGRLPAEAEWEYAARGAGGTRYPWGDVFDGSRLNYCDAACEFEWGDSSSNDGFARTAPVGSLSTGASWCNALDMAGNVWEWTADWYAAYPAERQTNPFGPETGRQRVTRGGGWDTNPAFSRATTRNWGLPGSSSNVTGFRCAISTQN